MDMMADFENLDVMLGSENNNPLERELADAIDQSSAHEDADTNAYHGNEYGNYLHESDLLRQNEVRQSFETFSNEFNIRLSREMDSMMSMMHSQINRAITAAIAERVIPEIRNIANSMSSTGHRDTEASSSPSQENRESASGPKIKITKKYSRSVGDLRETTGLSSYMVTGAIDTQQQIPEFVTGRIHSIPKLERQQSNHNVSLDATLPAPDLEVPGTTQDPLNRLTDVLVNLQNKPHNMTIRPVQTTPMTFFDGKSKKFELFEDLFHTMIKMQPTMTEQMKINHFHSLLRKGALQTFRNMNSINRQTLEDVLVIFRRKYVKPESQATAKHKWHRLTFDPSTMKLPDFLEELNQGAEKAFGENAKSMIGSLLYAKLPPK